MSRANGITRQTILNSIKHSGAMTADELARELNISQVAVRQHLSALESEGIIHITIERRGLGRPSHRYRLTENGDALFPRRYEHLTEHLIEELREWQGEEAVQELFARLTDRETHRLQGRMRGKSLPAKVQELARIQTEKGFMATVEMGESDGECHLVLHNCAVCTLARLYPHLCCRHEMELFAKVLGSEAGEVQIVRDTYILAGAAACSYRIHAADTEAAAPVIS